MHLSKLLNDNILWRELYYSISNPRIFIPHWWYKTPSDSEKLSFINYYANETGYIEFFDDKSYFRVIEYPENMREVVNTKPMSFIGVYSEPTICDVKTYPAKINIENKIPGVGSRPDLSVEILIRDGIKPSKELMERLSEYESIKSNQFEDDF